MAFVSGYLLASSYGQRLAISLPLDHAQAVDRFSNLKGGPRRFALGSASHHHGYRRDSLTILQTGPAGIWQGYCPELLC